VSPAHSGIVPPELLTSSSLFKGLDERELKLVSASLTRRVVKRGGIIYQEGDAGEEMYILVSGSAEAWIQSSDGKPHQLFEVKPGGFFGEMSIIADEKHPTTLTAADDLELLILKRADFHRIVFEHALVGIKILRAMIAVQNTQLEQSSRQLGDLMRWGATAQQRVICDELTGLYNRRFLQQTAAEHFKDGAVRLRPLSLLMLDLDKIHLINDRYGTRAGDLVFIATGEELRSVTRPSDICARLSGDEFAVLLPDTNAEGASIVAERIRSALEQRKIPIPSHGTSKTDIMVSTSIGISSAPLHADSWTNLYRTADNALLRSKNLGRNRVEVAQ